MRIVRICLMTSMLVYFSASCIVFVVPIASVVNNMLTNPGVSTLRSALLIAAELSSASIFGLTAFAIAKGWRTRNRWGIAASLLSICVPLPFLYWGATMFWSYLLACLWPSWLFGAIGSILFLKAGTPHSLIYDLRKHLGWGSQASEERSRLAGTQP
jgi:hypothetical protein